MDPGFTQEELNKISMSAEQLEHYSKPDELKRLILERDFFKKITEKQLEAINTASTRLNSVLYAPLSITYNDLFCRNKTVRIWLRISQVCEKLSL